MKRGFSLKSGIIPKVRKKIQPGISPIAQLSIETQLLFGSFMLAVILFAWFGQ